MAKIAQITTGYTKDGKPKIGGYKISLQKTEIENTSQLKDGDELEIEYFKNGFTAKKKK